MRSSNSLHSRKTAAPCAQPPRPAKRLIFGAFIGAFALLAPALPAQSYLHPKSDLMDEQIVLDPISENDIELRGRYARQWRDEDNTLIVVFNGGFRLDSDGRKLTANNAVLWIYQRANDAGRKYIELVVYLAERAEVTEPGGSFTEDNVLLVSNLRTYGKLIKLDDTHAPESLEESPLYQQALRDRLWIEQHERSAAAQSPEAIRTAEVRRRRDDRPQRVITYRLNNLNPQTTSSGESVFVATGGVYLAQSGNKDAPMLEIQADNAVVFPVEGKTRGIFDEEIGQPGAATTQPVRGEERKGPDPKKEGEKAGGIFAPRGISQSIRSVYLEGDVRLSIGNRFVRADRIYYDFERDRALLLDTVFRAEIIERNIPLYVRADEIRQLSAREFEAKNARLTTSEFYTPHYHVGARRIVIRDLTQLDTFGHSQGSVTGTYEMSDQTLNIEGVPILYWPYSQGRFDTSETALRRFRTAYSDHRGAELETAWHMFNLLGVAAPPGYDATLRMDYYSKRGPGVGVNVDYERDDHYGLFRGYYIHDHGEDHLGPLRKAEEDPDTENRGRILWRHRHYLPNDWEATIELAYISDPNYLEEWENHEFNTGKEQENVLYLKHAKDVEAVTFLANWRLLDFVTQTEHLPEAAYRRIGDTFASPVVLYHESRIGEVRYRGDDRRFFDDRRYDNLGNTDSTFRADAREEAELPLKLGPIRVVPFGTGRGTFWDGQPHDSGNLGRGLGLAGLRGGTDFSRVFPDVKSEMFDLNGVRHIIKPEVLAWAAGTNVDAQEITPFDEGIETIGGFYGVSMAIRQTWQTKRGPATNPRTVDFLEIDLEAGAFGDPQRDEMSNGYANPTRPEDSRTRNYFAGNVNYRVSDTTSLLYDFNFDLNDRSYDSHNVSLAVERDPRLSYLIGARYAGDINMSLIGGGWNYRMNEKHITAMRCWFDLDRGDLSEVTFSYIHKLPHWYTSITLEYDNVDDDSSVSFSIWPEGVPEWAIGNRRFTGLSQSTGIRP